jgi:hypothetical protein
MRCLLAAVSLISLVALGGCTTRSDREKNKDYDRPKAVDKAKDAK